MQADAKTSGGQSPAFEPPGSLLQAVWRCRRRNYRKECWRWWRFGPTAEQRASDFEFETPDNLWQAVWRCRDRRYLKEYVRWLRFGPDEAKDARIFEERWEAADKEGRQAIAKDQLDHRAHRQMGLTHHKSDVLTFYTILAAIFAALATIAPDRVRDYIGPAMTPVVGLMVIALLMALSSFSNRILYPLYTHFMGAAEYSNVVDEKSHVDQMRRETNRLSRVLQRGRRQFSLSKMAVYLAGAYAVLRYWLE